MQPQRYIAHLDLDSFFVSVEALLNPSLKGLPLIVGGSRERGVVSACSYEARAFGVKSAMPIQKAMALCPQAIVLKVSGKEYGRYSRWVTDIIAAKAPSFEKASIDEFYIDLTGMDKYFDPLQWTISLRTEIIDATGLPISFGLSANKLVSKIATDQAKPNGYLFVPHGNEQSFLSPLTLDKIPGVGDTAIRRLQEAGYYTIRDVQQKTAAEMGIAMGNWGADLWRRAMGISNSIVHESRIAKSISTENTFMDNISIEVDLLKHLAAMVEKVAYELRADEKMATCVTVKIRYPDFETTSKQMMIKPTMRDDELLPTAYLLFNRLYKKGKPVRLLGIKLSQFTDKIIQSNLFENNISRNKLYQVMDEVKNRFGKKSVRNASSGK